MVITNSCIRDVMGQVGSYISWPNLSCSSSLLTINDLGPSKVKHFWKLAMDTPVDYSSRIDQDVLILRKFELESGAVLEQAPIAYKTWGKLNKEKDNVMVICHAFTGSADVEDW